MNMIQAINKGTKKENKNKHLILKWNGVKFNFFW